MEEKKILQKKTRNFWNFLLLTEKKKNAIFLFLPIEDISLSPELSSLPRFRIQWGHPERDRQTNERRTEILVSNILLWKKPRLVWNFKNILLVIAFLPKSLILESFSVKLSLRVFRGVRLRAWSCQFFY